MLDAALLQEVIGGHDKRDSTSIPEGPRPMVAAAREGMKRDLKGLKVGLIKELGGEASSRAYGTLQRRCQEA